MAQRFQGKVIFVTGAASGIGRATSIKLALQGATLYLTDINASALTETLSQCSSAHSSLSHQTHVLDVGDSSACTEAIEACVAQLGRIDHVFNCAGINPTPYALEDTTDAYYDRLFNVNVRGMYAVTRAAIPHLERSASESKDRWGKPSFVNVSSISGIRPTASVAIYCATKTAIIGFSKSMALELGKKGVRVNILAPGFIDTPTNASVVAGEESIKRIEAKVSLGRMGTPDECADVVAFLMSDEARYMNGSVVEANGGMAP
ncbi:hypothetical protein AAFC00_006200 [Neodothiora populina]|uniref:NAD(P)-binding protein n=1 Tax=Neodothiora populina TaxID=2781224 RepID=A0ABR3P4E0_9PEZI